jgi:hypothetical protein
MLCCTRERKRQGEEAVWISKDACHSVHTRTTMRNVLKGTDARNFISRMDHGGCFPLCPHQHNVDQFRSGRYRVHLFEVVDRHDSMLR